MNTEYCPESWLDVSQTLDRLQALTGRVLGSRGLLKLCQAELCRAYVDCSFACGVVDDEQLFVRRIRGAGYCELLDAGEQGLCMAEAGSLPALTVRGAGIVVYGLAWVYSTEQEHPSREEGIWRMSLGGLRRSLYFKPADIHTLAERIRAGEQRLQARRVSG